MGLSLLNAEISANKKRDYVVASAIYRGPILLAYDPRHTKTDPDDFPILDACKLKLKQVEERTWLKPWMLFEMVAQNGSRIRLCDFGSAGVAGNTYKSWLPVKSPTRQQVQP